MRNNARSCALLCAAVDAITEKWFAVTHYMTHRRQALVECVHEVRAFYQLLGELDAFLLRLEPHLEGSPSASALPTSATASGPSPLTHEQLVDLLVVASSAQMHASFADLQARFTRVKKLFFDEQLREFESDYELCLLKWTKVNIKLYAPPPVHFTSLRSFAFIVLYNYCTVLYCTT